MGVGRLKMLAGARLDPFSTRLLAIHQQAKRPATASEHASPVVAAAVAEYAAEAGTGAELAEPLALPASELDTGCAECGGKGATSPVDELRQEIAAIKEHLAALEDKVAQLDADSGQLYQPR